MDENPRELPEGVASVKQTFANEITQQDKKALSPMSDDFFINKNSHE